MCELSQRGAKNARNPFQAFPLSNDEAPFFSSGMLLSAFPALSHTE